MAAQAKTGDPAVRPPLSDQEIAIRERIVLAIIQNIPGPPSDPIIKQTGDAAEKLTDRIVGRKD